MNKNTKWENVGTEQHSNTNWFFFRKIESLFWARLLTLWTYSTTHRHTRSPPILPSKMVITKTENFNLFRCDRRFVSLNVVHLFKMVKTCNSGIIHKQKGEMDQFLILLFDHQWPCNQLLLMCFVVTCSKPMNHEII